MDIENTISSLLEQSNEFMYRTENSFYSYGSERKWLMAAYEDNLAETKESTLCSSEEVIEKWVRKDKYYKNIT